MATKYQAPSSLQADEVHRPRLIVWNLSPENGSPRKISSNEQMLVLEGISRFAKPIVILTGSHILELPSLNDVVAYGHALGLKMVLEVEAEDLSEEMLLAFRAFGPRVFRVLLRDEIQEDLDTRYRQTPAFLALERTVRELKDAGFELHFSIVVREPNIRAIEVALDYAIQRGARGVYFQLLYRNQANGADRMEETAHLRDEFIVRLSQLKQFLPRNMYLSPQCIKYGYRENVSSVAELVHERDADDRSEWAHWCLSGRSYAYIDSGGKVYTCGGSLVECGDLTLQHFNFEKIWEQSEAFAAVRERHLTCLEARILFQSMNENLLHGVTS